MKSDTKRQNFNITAEQEAELAWLREALAAPTTKDAILRAVRVLAVLAREAQQGRSLYVGTPDGQLTQLLLPELAPVQAAEWNYLVARPHPWRRQLYVKGRRLRAFDVWVDMQTNQRTAQEVAADWDLPLEAIHEIQRYCQSHQDLLALEAAEERRRLVEGGVRLEPETAHR